MGSKSGIGSHNFWSHSELRKIPCGGSLKSGLKVCVLKVGPQSQAHITHCPAPLHTNTSPVWTLGYAYSHIPMCNEGTHTPWEVLYFSDFWQLQVGDKTWEHVHWCQLIVMPMQWQAGQGVHPNLQVLKGMLLAWWWSLLVLLAQRACRAVRHPQPLWHPLAPKLTWLNKAGTLALARTAVCFMKALH